VEDTDLAATVVVDTDLAAKAGIGLAAVAVEVGTDQARQDTVVASEGIDWMEPNLLVAFTAD